MMTENRLPPLNWLRAFEASARHLSFTEAAGELGMTQSAVSQQIKSLESFLGRPLFLRRPRALQLTDSARTYLPTVQAAFSMLNEGTETFLGNDPDTTLDIHSNLAFTVLWLTPRIDRFLADHPWVVLNISTSVWTTEYTRPYASVEIRFGGGMWEGVPGERLVSEFYYPVCSPEIANTLSGPSSISGHRLIDVSGMLESWESWFRAAGIGGRGALPVHRASTYVVTLEMARRSLGVALAHDLVATPFLETGELAQPFDIKLPQKEAYYLITPPEGTMNPAALAFREWLLAEMTLPA